MLFMASCQSDNEFADGNYGYLRLAVGVNTSTNVSRAGEEVTYNPKQIAVQIINASGEVVKETDNWENWNNVQVALPVGTYSLKASSAGFDGQTSAFDKPYYAGSTEFTITKNAEVNATVTCTLANVKVSVIFDESFKSKFKSATVTVGSLETSSTIGDLEFVMGENDTQSAYFPVVDLKAKLAVVNMAGYSFSQTDNIEGVAARDHYILKYQLAEEGKGDVNITVDPSSKTYTYTFNVTTEPSTTLSVDKANAWSNFASLSGSILTSETLDATKVAFEYKLKDASEWTKVAATAGSANTYTAKATGLTPNSSYDFRMVYGEEEYVSGASTFTTEGAKALPNGSFDDWYKDDKVIYACSEAD